MIRIQTLIWVKVRFNTYIYTYILLYLSFYIYVCVISESEGSTVGTEGALTPKKPSTKSPASNVKIGNAICPGCGDTKSNLNTVSICIVNHYYEDPFKLLKHIQYVDKAGTYIINIFTLFIIYIYCYIYFL